MLEADDSKESSPDFEAQDLLRRQREATGGFCKVTHDWRGQLGFREMCASVRCEKIQEGPGGRDQLEVVAMD